MGYLGLQDATRKRRPNSQTPWERTGSITLLLENVGLCGTVSEKKWLRAKEITCNMLEEFNYADHYLEMNLKDMEHKTVFLLQLDTAYPLLLSHFTEYDLSMPRLYQWY